MAERWITDASPLISLAKIGQSRLLTDLPDELLIPDAVASEVLSGPEGDPARRLLETGFGHRATPSVVPSRLFAWSLGRGETDALALGLETASATVVLDDAAARRCARALSLPIIGTLGVVIRAKRLGWIPSAAETFQALREADFRIDDATARAILAAVDEEWRGR